MAAAPRVGTSGTGKHDIKPDSVEPPRCCLWAPIMAPENDQVRVEHDRYTRWSTGATEHNGCSGDERCRDSCGQGRGGRGGGGGIYNVEKGVWGFPPHNTIFPLPIADENSINDK